MRLSLVISCPALASGTLKSTRMKTRLPLQIEVFDRQFGHLRELSKGVSKFTGDKIAGATREECWRHRLSPDFLSDFLSL